MGESSQQGADADVHAVLGIEDVVDVDKDVAPSVFPTGSEVHSLDSLLAAYLLDMEVFVPHAADASLRVLLIEPDASLRRVLWEMLEVAGHKRSATRCDRLADDLTPGFAWDDPVSRGISHEVEARRSPVPGVLDEYATKRSCERQSEAGQHR